MAAVAVVGVGAIGATFAAAALATGRHELTLCSRRARDHVLVRRPAGGSVTLGPVRPTAPAGPPPDWVLLATKSHQIPSAASLLRSLVGPATRVVALQNGVEHIEQLDGLVPGERVVPAVVWAGAVPTADGDVEVRTEPARLVVPDGVDGADLRELFAGSFAEVELIDDFRTEAWRKLVLNAVIGLEALAVQPARMFRLPAVRDLALAYATECVAVARADGAQLPDELAEQTVARLAATAPDATTSMLVDRRRGRPLEWQARNGVITRTARRHDLRTPVSDVVTALLEAADLPSPP